MNVMDFCQCDYSIVAVMAFVVGAMLGVFIFVLIDWYLNKEEDPLG